MKTQYLHSSFLSTGWMYNSFIQEMCQTKFNTMKIHRWPIIIFFHVGKGRYTIALPTTIQSFRKQPKRLKRVIKEISHWCTHIDVLYVEKSIPSKQRCILCTNTLIFSRHLFSQDWFSSLFFHFVESAKWQFSNNLSIFYFISVKLLQKEQFYCLLFLVLFSSAERLFLSLSRIYIVAR